VGRGSGIGIGQITAFRSPITDPDPRTRGVRWVRFSRREGVGVVGSDGTGGGVLGSFFRAGSGRSAGARWVRFFQRLSDGGRADAPSGLAQSARCPVGSFFQGSTGIQSRTNRNVGFVFPGATPAVFSYRPPTTGHRWVRFSRRACVGPFGPPLPARVRTQGGAACRTAGILGAIRRQGRGVARRHGFSASARDRWVVSGGSGRS
jgi:hypothetical protein